jgi:hypothetical protein
LVVNAGTASPAPMMTTLRKSIRTRPKRRWSGAATKEPSRLPIANVVSRTPKAGSERCIGPGETAYSTSTAKVAVDARFMPPTMKAIVRSTRFRHR